MPVIEYSYTMEDDSILSRNQIDAKLRDAERALATIARVEKVVGRLCVDEESVRLAIRDIRRRFEITTRGD